MKSKNKRYIFHIDRNSHFQNAINSNKNKNFRFKITKARCPWSSHEDQIIKKLIKINGTSNWSLIASEMKKFNGNKIRTGKQCRERWHNHLNPYINKTAWSDKEDKVLFLKHLEYGNKWSEISKYLSGRTDNNIKNHFYSRLRKYIRKILRQMNKEKNWFNIHEIDQNKYNSDNLYHLIKKLNIPYVLLNSQYILEIILKSEGRIEEDKEYKNYFSSFNYNQNIKKQIINETINLIISKDIFITENFSSNKNQDFTLKNLKETIPLNVNNYSLDKFSPPKIIDSTSVSPVTLNTYHNGSIERLPKKQITSQFNSINGMENYNLVDFYSDWEKNKFDNEKECNKVISPLNIPNNSFGFPIFSTTNTSFNLNFENVIIKENGKELCLNHEKENIDDSNREFQFPASNYVKSTQFRDETINTNTDECKLHNKKKNTIRGLTKNRNIKYKSDPKNESSTLIDTNNSILIKEGTIIEDYIDLGNPRRKLNNKLIPLLDIETIKNSNTDKIFSQCVINAYNRIQPFKKRSLCECDCTKCINNAKHNDNIYTNEFNVNNAFVSPRFSI